MKSIPIKAPVVKHALDQQTTEFIKFLHRGGAHRFTQNLAGKVNQSVWSRTDEPLKLPPLDGSENLYVAVNPATVRVTDADRTKYPGKPDSWIEGRVLAKNSTIAAINCLYTDFDGPDFTSPTEDDITAQLATLQAAPRASEATRRNMAYKAAQKALYKLEPAKYLALALARVKSVDLSPSALVFSGGGYQAYWLLDEPFILRTDEDRKLAIDAQARWVAFTGGDDGAKDLRRILRIPGFYNHKPAYAPDFPQVKFLKCDLEHVYKLAWLVALLPSVPATKSKSPKPPKAPKTKPSTEPSTEQSIDQERGATRLIDRFNESVSIVDALLHYGYSVANASNRMIRPGGENASVQINTVSNTSYHFNSGDELHSSHQRTPFDVFCHFAHSGDVKAAVDALAARVFGELRLWARTTSFAPFVKLEADQSYRSDRNDTKVATAIFEVMERTRRFSLEISNRQLAKLAGIGSHSTVTRSLERLSGWLFDIDAIENRHSSLISLVDNLRLYKMSHFRSIELFKSGSFCTNEELSDSYTPNMAAEPFLSGTSKIAKEQIKNVAQALGITSDEVKEKYVFGGLGESGLRVVDALLRDGDQTAQELAETTQKKLYAIRRACRELEARGVIESTREGKRGPKTYALVLEHDRVIAEVAPTLRTYTLEAQRANKRLERHQVFIAQCIEFGRVNHDQAYEAKMQHRFNNLASKRLPHLARLFPTLDEHEINGLAYNVAMSEYDSPIAQARLQRLLEKAHAKTMGLTDAYASVAKDNPVSLGKMSAKSKHKLARAAALLDFKAQRGAHKAEDRAKVDTLAKYAIEATQAGQARDAIQIQMRAWNVSDDLIVAAFKQAGAYDKPRFKLPPMPLLEISI